MADLITPYSQEKVEPENGTDFKLDELYRLLDCDLIAIEELDDGRIMIYNDEYLYDGSEYSLFGTIFAKYHKAIPPEHFICGNILICKNEEFN